MKKVIIFIIIFFIVKYIQSQTPNWQWATSIGGSEWDEGRSITTDDSGNIYVTGAFTETITFGPYSLTCNGDWDIFVAKMDANGNWQWAIQPEESYRVDGFKITIDNSGNIYIIGFFDETLTFGSDFLISNGGSDAFIVKIDTDGNFQWANSYGGSEWDGFNDITIDGSGNIFINGSFENHLISTRFIITKLDTNGNWLLGIPESGNRAGNGIAIDNIGNIYLTGTFSDTITFGSFSLISNGSSDIFVVKMDPNGICQWAVQAGGDSYDSGSDIISDSAGNIYIAGRFIYSATFGPHSIEGNVYSNAFVSNIDSNGNWQWIIQPEGSDNLVHVEGIITDNIGNIYITGGFNGVVTFGSDSLTCYGEDNIFLACTSEDGNWLWGAQAGGDNSDIGWDVTVDNSEKIYITGIFSTTSTFGTHLITSNGICDAFIAKLSCETDISDELVNMPTVKYLSNYPNPFNPETTISFELPINSENVSVEIFNIKGKKIRQYSISNNQSSIVWNGKDNQNKAVSSGIYLYKLNVNGKIKATNKCLLLK